MLALPSFAQDAERSSPGKPDSPDPEPKNVSEMLVKMQIDQEKKEYEEMIDRSQQALKISEELQRNYTVKNQFSRDDLDKLTDLEKLTKKIRSELGAEGHDDGSEEDSEVDPVPNNTVDAVKALGTIASKLADELKKTSRFGISVAAIQSSNSLLRVVRFLKSSR